MLAYLQMKCTGDTVQSVRSWAQSQIDDINIKLHQHIQTSNERELKYQKHNESHKLHLQNTLVRMEQMSHEREKLRKKVVRSF